MPETRIENRINAILHTVRSIHWLVFINLIISSLTALFVLLD